MHMLNISCVTPFQTRSTASGNRSGLSRCVHTRVGAGRILVLAIAGLLAQASPSRAGVVIDFVESGSNVVATLSGSISSLTGATQFFFSEIRSNTNSVNSSSAFVSFSNTSVTDTYNAYRITTVPVDFGTSDPVFYAADSSTASTTMIVQS